MTTQIAPVALNRVVLVRPGPGHGRDADIPVAQCRLNRRVERPFGELQPFQDRRDLVGRCLKSVAPPAGLSDNGRLRVLQRDNDRLAGVINTVLML